MAASLFRRVSSHLARLPRPLLPSVSLENPFAQAPPAVAPSHPHFSFGASMELMAVPKKKVSRYKKGLRNGPKALKPVPVIVRCNKGARMKEDFHSTPEAIQQTLRDRLIDGANRTEQRFK